MISGEAPPEFKKVTELTGELVDIEVALIQQTGKNSYLGCPTCAKAIQGIEAGRDTQCPRRCGTIVKAKLLTWHSFLAGDDTGEIIVKFSPQVASIPQEGGYIIAEGNLQEGS